ncbi:MAG: type 2 isopentenyl-diphosphate Delta-isomerase [Candidatus Bathyarchaeota archaeon]|nr:type 2 isopentenyl-diphosphate Delta-isomerase [Candidatus Bathyarchaeota archaeon]
MNNQIEERKVDHIRVCLEENVQAQRKTTGFEDIFLVHKALPEIERKQIGLSTVVFKHEFSAPLLVGAMTGGTEKASKINAAIAEAVEELGLGMGVGSQRVAIEDPRLEGSFAIAREKAPTAFLVANIGGAQLVDGYGAKEAKRAVKILKANALAIHLNPLQEAVQPEGETNYSGVIDKIGEITRALEVPVIVKETGAGIATEEAKKLEEAGVAGIDVAGVGGTSWAAVEFHRAKRARDKFRQRLGQTFWDWGIPTAPSLVEVARSVHIPVIASGGIRFGTEAAKSLALGASLVSMTAPILKATTKGPEEVKQTLQFVIEELRNTMFLVGAESVLKLQEKPVVLTGKTAEWLRMRGFKPELYARRKA